MTRTVQALDFLFDILGVDHKKASIVKNIMAGSSFFTIGTGTETLFAEFVSSLSYSARDALNGIDSIQATFTDSIDQAVSAADIGISAADVAIRSVGGLQFLMGALFAIRDFYKGYQLNQQIKSLKSEEKYL